MQFFGSFLSDIAFTENGSLITIDTSDATTLKWQRIYKKHQNYQILLQTETYSQIISILSCKRLVLYATLLIYDTLLEFPGEWPPITNYSVIHHISQRTVKQYVTTNVMREVMHFFENDSTLKINLTLNKNMLPMYNRKIDVLILI